MKENVLSSQHCQYLRFCIIKWWFISRQNWQIIYNCKSSNCLQRLLNNKGIYYIRRSYTRSFTRRSKTGQFQNWFRSQRLLAFSMYLGSHLQCIGYWLFGGGGIYFLASFWGDSVIIPTTLLKTIISIQPCKIYWNLFYGLVYIQFL